MPGKYELPELPATARSIDLIAEQFRSCYVPASDGGVRLSDAAAIAQADYEARAAAIDAEYEAASAAIDRRSDGLKRKVFDAEVERAVARAGVPPELRGGVEALLLHKFHHVEVVDGEIEIAILDVFGKTSVDTWLAAFLSSAEGQGYRPATTAGAEPGPFAAQMRRLKEGLN